MHLPHYDMHAALGVTGVRATPLRFSRIEKHFSVASPVGVHREVVASRQRRNVAKLLHLYGQMGVQDKLEVD